MLVCIHYFKDDIERTFTYNDGLRTVTVTRDRIALKKTAVSRVFPNFPPYLNEFQANRLSLDDKKRLQMESTFSKSNNEETVDESLVNSFSDLPSKLNLIDLRSGWITHLSDNILYFLSK